MLDFRKRKKNFMTVVLENDRKLFVLPPKKRIFAEIVNFDENNPEEVYELAAQVLSNNKQKIEVSADDIAEWDATDIRYLVAE